MSNFKNLVVVNHPVIQDRLSFIRNKDTSSADFKQGLYEISLFLGYEVTKALPLSDLEVETPITTMVGAELKQGNPVIIPILRAGLGFTAGLETLLPRSSLGHIGVYRDEETKRPKEYLVKLPEIKNKQIIVADPMLATGHSAKYAIDLLVERGANPADICLMILVAAPEGVTVIEEAHPEVSIFTASLDERLNENAYIVPGLGDAGDRIFNTKQ